jgi:hypothetical protein
MAAATTFAGVVDLIRKAEALLITKAGQSDPVDRASILRGIYYGTEWSLDYKVESKRNVAGARIRNIGFVTYTGGHLPGDPRPALAGTTLFDDLQKSQSIHDRGRGIDVGHVLIGLETRNSATLRNVPFAGQGGTGLEIVTWLWDLGGGAASLARRRVTAPRTSVEVVFNNTTSDYGVMDNLEGDAGGYLVGCGSTPGGASTYGTGKGVADVLADYLPLTSAVQWGTRASRFATALGGTVVPTGITNTTSMVSQLTDKLYDFAVWYAATRWVPSGELLGPAATTACMHMRGAAQEVATVFVAALSRGIIVAGSSIQAAGPYPAPSAPAPCTSTLLKAASSNPSAVRKQLEEWHKDLGKLFE